MASYSRDDFYRREPRRADYAVSERSADTRNRTPGFLMRDEPRGGELVLRSKKTESGYAYHRSPSSSPSPDRHSMIRRPRSLSPDGRAIRARSLSRMRCVGRGRSPSPESHISFSTRRRSPSADRFRAKIAERAPSPEPEPELEPAKVIKGPTIEREVITHWRDIDHGVIRARSPSPVQAARRSLPVIHKDIDIDVDVYHRDRRGHQHHTDVDIDIHHSRSPARRRSRSRSRSRSHFHDDSELVIRSDRDRLEVGRHKHRSHSAQPIRSPSPSYGEEADYITSRIDARGQMGEAYNGHTKDWTIVDVPPGTERVRMDGVGGGSADVTWSRYSGVRRTKFVPEREPDHTSRSSSSDAGREGKMSVQIYDKNREIEIEASHQRRARTSDMWTEITKDLVVREAIERMNYEYEETDHFFYIMEYLKYEDVVQLVNLSDEIREVRRKRAREIEWEREFRNHHHHIDITATHTHTHRSRSRRRRRSPQRRWDDLDRGREVVFDKRYF